MKAIQIKVKPNARERRLEELSDGTWLAQVRAPPRAGRANEELVALVARHFKLPKTQVSIKRGSSGRMKLVQIDDGR